MYNPATKAYYDSTENFDRMQDVAKEFAYDYLCSQKMKGLYPEEIWEDIVEIVNGDWEFDVTLDLADDMVRLTKAVIERMAEKRVLSFSRKTEEHLWEKALQWLKERIESVPEQRRLYIFLSTNKHAGHEDGSIFKSL